MSNPIPAATIVLARSRESEELYLIRRSQHLRFFGGFWAFPGGKVDAADRAVPWRGRRPDDGLLAIRSATAARELFEETGVLLARRTDGSFPVAEPAWERVRLEVADGRRSFGQFLQETNLALAVEDFTQIGEVTTPEFAPQRYATTFLAGTLPPGQTPRVCGKELDEGRFVSAADMLVCWNRGACLLSPPTIMTLEAVAGRPVLEAPLRLGLTMALLKTGKIHPIYFAPCVQMIPLRTMALPPSTHTNAYLIGSGPVYLLDPGPSDPSEQQRLIQVLDEKVERGRKLDGIVLTHHHPDHIGAVVACAERYRVPVWAHPLTAELVRDKFAVDHLLNDGACLDLGPCPDGGGPWHMRAMHTPGHAPGHLVFYEPRYRLLFAGDMISTLSSVVIAPPEGDLTQYLESLRRMRDLDCRLLLPAHGNASTQSRQTIDDNISLRLARETQLLDALMAEPQSLHTIDDLARAIYRGLPHNLMKYAKLQLHAGLIKLEREGKVMHVVDGWRLAEKS
ncbi:MAG: MBL fold metallo-hydrolase [Planctomycetes bacterium]|nr:MBL fold metallo-hydrolase [Planctomycetota bacterium]